MRKPAEKNIGVRLTHEEAAAVEKMRSQAAAAGIAMNSSQVIRLCIALAANLWSEDPRTVAEATRSLLLRGAI